jgi:hypothetical protein
VLLLCAGAWQITRVYVQLSLVRRCPNLRVFSAFRGGDSGPHVGQVLALYLDFPPAKRYFRKLPETSANFINASAWCPVTIITAMNSNTHIHSSPTDSKFVSVGGIRVSQLPFRCPHNS